MSLSRREFLATNAAVLAAMASHRAKAQDTPATAPSIYKESTRIPTRTVDAESRPNVVWIVNDASRARNYSCYGHTRPTSPNIDALAQEGVVCERAYSPSFSTLASVSSYMTSQYFPFPVGDLMVQSRVANETILLHVPENEILAPKVFEANGYRTFIASANRGFVTTRCRLARAFQTAVAPRPFDWGVHSGKASFKTINDEVFSYLARDNSTQPFFLYLHGVETHSPYLIPNRRPFNQWVDYSYKSKNLIGFRPVFRPERNRSYSSDDVDHLHGLYDGTIRHADHYIGQLLDFLDGKKLLDNTIIVYTSDHGEALLEEGGLWGHMQKFGGPDSTNHVPLILRGPSIPSGGRIKGVVSSIDILPTLVYLCGLEAKGYVDGKHFCDLFETEDESCPRVALTKSGRGINLMRLHLTNKAYRYVYDLDAHSDHLIGISGNFRSTKDLKVSAPDVKRSMRSQIDNHLLPLIDASRIEREDFGTATRFLFVKESWLTSILSPAYADRVTTISSEADLPQESAGWYFLQNSRLGPHLVCRPTTSPASFSMPVTRVEYDGESRIWVEVYADPESAAGEEALISVGDGAKPSASRSYGLLENATGWTFIDCGSTLSNIVSFTGEPGKVLRVRSIILFAAAIADAEEQIRKQLLGLTAEDLEERQESLEALGYLH